MYQRSYHAEVPLHTEEKLLIPQVFQILHIDGKQQGPLHCVGHVSTLAFIEVPKGSIVHQRLPMEHWSREPGLRLGLNVYFLLLTVRRNP